jgi:hypothetical protein
MSRIDFMIRACSCSPTIIQQLAKVAPASDRAWYWAVTRSGLP